MRPFTSTSRPPISVRPLSRTVGALPISRTRSFPQTRSAYPALLSSRLVRIAPILFFQTYLTGSIIAFAFGPVNFEIANPYILFSYVAVGQLTIALGYKLGIARAPRRYTGFLPARTLLQIAILLTLILLPITIHYRNYGNLSLAEALANPNAAYMARLEDGTSSPLFLATRLLLAPLLALFVPMGVVYWSSMRLPWKILWGVGMAGLTALATFSGAAIGLFDLVLVIPWMLWLASHHRSVQTVPELRRPRSAISKGSLQRRAGLVIITFAILFAGIKYFSYSRQSRYQLASNEYPLWTTGWSEDTYGIPLPESVEYTVYMICNYWSHGYEGLSQCLELPFEWSFGCGHSRLLTNCVGLLGADRDTIEDRTYPLRLQAISGYDAYGVWHTAYPWLASDFTFCGALLFMGWMGYLLALVWKDAVCKSNPFAIGFLAQLLIFFYYIPANCGRLSFPEEAVAFWGTLLLWLLTRERFAPVHLALQRGVLHGQR